jgi:hypothetical protein
MALGRMDAPFGIGSAAPVSTLQLFQSVFMVACEARRSMTLANVFLYFSFQSDFCDRTSCRCRTPYGPTGTKIHLTRIRRDVFDGRESEDRKFSLYPVGKNGTIAYISRLC